MCYWYVLEIKRIANNIIRKYGNKKKIVSISLEQVVDWRNFKNFLNQLNIKIPDRKEYEKIIDTKWNIKDSRKENKQPCNIDKEENSVLLWFNNKNATQWQIGGN